MHSKVSSDWLPSYIKAKRPVLEIFKRDGHFPDSLHMCTTEQYFLLLCMFQRRDQISIRISKIYLYRITDAKLTMKDE